MRTQPILAVICFALLFYGCSKKSTPNPSNQITIVGKWTLTSYDYTHIVNGYSDGTMQTINTDTGVYIRFNADGTGLNSSGGSGAGNYIINHFTYSLNKNILLYTTSNGNQTGTLTDTVKGLTATNLTFIQWDKAVQGGSTYNDAFEYYYSK